MNLIFKKTLILSFVLFVSSHAMERVLLDSFPLDDYSKSQNQQLSNIPQSIEHNRRFLEHYVNEIDRKHYWELHNCPEKFSENPSQYAQCVIGQTMLNLQQIPERISYYFYNLTNPNLRNLPSFGLDNLPDFPLPQEIPNNDEVPNARSYNASLREFESLPAEKFSHSHRSESLSLEEQISKIAQSPSQRAQLEKRIVMQLAKTQQDLERMLINQQPQRLPTRTSTIVEIPQYVQLHAIKQIEQERILKMRDTYSDTLQSLGSIAYLCGNQKMSGQIFDFGAGSLKLYDSFNKFFELYSTPGVSLDAFSNPMSGFLMGTCLLSKAFGSDRSKKGDGLGKMMRVLAQSIQFLSKQAYEYHKINMERFNQLESLFTSHHASMLEQFFALHQTTDDFQVAFNRFTQAAQHCADLQLQTSNFSNQLLIHTQQTLSNNLQALRIEPITKLIQRTTLEMQKEKNSPEKRASLVDKLFIEATTGAQGAYVTGTNIHSYHEIVTALKPNNNQITNHYNHPAFSTINLFTQYIGTRFNEPIKQSCNPLLWIKTTDALISYLEKQLQKDFYFPASRHEQEALREKLTTLLDQGSTMVHSIQQLGTGTRKSDLFADYKTTLEELLNAITHFQTAYEQKKIEEIGHELKKIRDAQLFTLNSNNLELKTVIDKIRHGAYIFSPEANAYRTHAGFLPGLVTRTISYKYEKDLPLKKWNSVNTPEMAEISSLENNKKAIEDIIKKFNQNKRQIQVDISKKSERIIQETIYKLFQNPLSILPANNDTSMYQTISSANPEVYNLALQLPDNLPLNQYFLAVQSNSQLGTISAEYEINNNKFFIKLYLTHAHQKKLILSMVTDYPNLIFDETKYSPNEALWLFWYGGRYAKKGDEVNVVHTSRRLALPTLTYSLSNNYPPVTPYTGARETFCAQAINEPIADLAQTEQELKQRIEQQLTIQKLEYNKKLLAELSPSGKTHSLFALLQKLDAQYKILDGVCALLYQENYTTHEAFQLFRASHNELLKNSDAIMLFLENYENNLELISSGKYLQDFIRITLAQITETAALIEPLPVQELRDATILIRKLKALLEQINQRNIRNAPASQKNDMHLLQQALEKRDIQLAELQKTSQRNQQEMQNQLQLMTQQLAAMATLLQTFHIKNQ